jgi:hypothetical protein
MGNLHQPLKSNPFSMMNFTSVTRNLVPEAIPTEHTDTPHSYQLHTEQKLMRGELGTAKIEEDINF